LHLIVDYTQLLVLPYCFFNYGICSNVDVLLQDRQNMKEGRAGEGRGGEEREGEGRRKKRK
jgi:hypothetical protein